MDYSSDAITLEQVIVYVSEYLTFSDVYSLPTTTTTTLDSYVLPLIQKYTSEAGQMLIIQNQIGTITYKENNTTNTNRLEELVRISIRVADNYEVEENWWEQMYVKGGNN